MRKPHYLIVRQYAACLIDLNEYLDLFLGEKLSKKTEILELNENLLNIMPNSWSKQEYVQVLLRVYSF